MLDNDMDRIQAMHTVLVSVSPPPLSNDFFGTGPLPLNSAQKHSHRCFKLSTL